MTEGQRNLFDRRTDRIAREPTTSRNKGRGPDPLNWGRVKIPKIELDIEKQCEELLAYETKKALEGESLDQLGTNKEVPNKPQTRKESTPTATEGQMAPTATHRVAEAISGYAAPRVKEESPRVTPSAQIAVGSYLGTILHGATRATGRSKPSDSSSESSDSSMEDPPHDIETKGKEKHRRPRTLIQPIASKEYNASPDARAYYRFVMEGTDYVRMGKVAYKRRAFVLSRFLKGRAYDFYTQKVAMNPYGWDLQEFFEEMFDYCFPINYQMEQRDKPRQAFQHDKNVTDYCYELEELYNMIGIFNKREKVVKLWNGLQNNIQSVLWWDGLYSEASSWIDVRWAAERIEIAENIANRSDRRDKFRKHSQRHAWNGPGNRNSLNKGPSAHERKSMDTTTH
ncbi:hypothetical protein C0993_005032 [Termitomyces sp. T159_Od127]|nr:hypothetical protein C0993_005032 [Termitomyces sp. T159_Od127]